MEWKYPKNGARMGLLFMELSASIPISREKLQYALFYEVGNYPMRASFNS
jgi:hypothetical protein